MAAARNEEALARYLGAVQVAGNVGAVERMMGEWLPPSVHTCGKVWTAAAGGAVAQALLTSDFPVPCEVVGRENDAWFAAAHAQDAMFVEVLGRAGYPHPPVHDRARVWAACRRSKHVTDALRRAGFPEG